MKSTFLAFLFLILLTEKSQACIETFLNHTHPTACCFFPDMAISEEIDNCIDECVPGQLCCTRECYIEQTGLYENGTIHKDKFIEIIMASLQDESAKASWKDIVVKNTEKCLNFGKERCNLMK